MIKFENASNGRFYYLYIERDLLNDRVLVCCRGGLNRSGIVRIICTDPAQIEKRISQITRVRLKRGYRIVN